MNSIVCIKCKSVNHINRDVCFKCGVNFLSDNYSTSSKKKNKTILFILSALLMTTLIGFLGYKTSQLFNTFSQNESIASKPQNNHQKGQEIWDKMLEASGEKKGDLKSMVMKGKMEIYLNSQPIKPEKAVAKGSYDFYFKDPNKFYAQVQLNTPSIGGKKPTLTIVQKSFDGEKGWEQKTEFEKNLDWLGGGFTGGRNETTREFSQNEIEEIKNELLGRLIKNFSDFTYQSENINTDQEKIFILSAKDKNGKICTIHIDQQSYLISLIRLPPFEYNSSKMSNKEYLEKRDTYVSELIFSNYKSINGYQVPLQMIAKTNGISTKMDFDEILIDGDLSDDSFRLATIESPKQEKKKF